jgi:hypothetical protein
VTFAGVTNHENRGRSSGQGVEQRLVERGQVAGVAAGDEVAVHDDLLVDPLATRVADVGLQARPRGQPLANAAKPSTARIEEPPACEFSTIMGLRL